MANHIIMTCAAATLTLAAGIASAETITNRSGNSTSTVTQEGGGPVHQQVIRTPDGQKVITRSGGNTSTVTQKSGGARGIGSAREEEDYEAMLENECLDGPASDGKRADADEDCRDSIAAMDDTMRMRRRALDSTDRNEPKRFGPGFENAQALREWMDRVRPQ